MTKVVLLAAVVLGIVAVGTGRVDGLRSQFSGLHINLFNGAPQYGLSTADPDKRAWDAVTAQANTICTHAADAAVATNVKIVLSANRAQFLRSTGASIVQERSQIAALEALQPPPGYAGGYATFLHERKRILAAVRRIRHAVKTRNRRQLVRALQALVTVSTTVDRYVHAYGMPACQY